MYMTFGQKQLNFKIGIVKIGKEFPSDISKKSKNGKEIPYKFSNRNFKNFKKVISGTIPRNEHFVLKFSFHRRSEILPDERQNTATFFQVQAPLFGILAKVTILCPCRARYSPHTPNSRA